MRWHITAVLKPKFRNLIETDSLKLTDEELEVAYNIKPLSDIEREELRGTVYELAKLLYVINEPKDESK
jgi:hypothetical protein